MAKLIDSIPDGYSLDYERIWKKQELYPSLAYEINKIAQGVNKFIQQSNGVIVTEYCKKEETWKKLQNCKYEFSKEFINDLVNKSILEEKIRSEVKSEKLTKELNIETEIIKLGGPYWRRLIEEGIKRRILSPMEIDLLQVAASIDTDRPKVASSKQAKLIWKIREKLENNGVLV